MDDDTPERIEEDLKALDKRLANNEITKETYEAEKAEILKRVEDLEKKYGATTPLGYKKIIFAALLFIVLAGAVFLLAQKYATPDIAVETGHFEVHAEDAALKEKIALDAEIAYANILNDLGVKDESEIAGDKINIYIYPNQEAYLQATGRQEWSIGYSAGDTVNLIHDSKISYVMPHEISHILLRRYVGGNYPPKWVDEGFAVYEEEKISDVYVRTVLSKKILLFKEGDYFSMDELSKKDISSEKDLEKVRFWYAQSYSIVKFLIEEHGREKFSRFCTVLAQGVPLESAIQEVYPGTFSGSSDLIDKWAEYVKKHDEFESD
jgi:hypothetical protein